MGAATETTQSTHTQHDQMSNGFTIKRSTLLLPRTQNSLFHAAADPHLSKLIIAWALVTQKSLKLFFLHEIVALAGVKEFVSNAHG